MTVPSIRGLSNRNEVTLMSESLAAGAHGVRLNAIPDNEAGLELHPEVSAASRDSSLTHEGGLPSDHNLAVRGALGSYALAMGTESGLEQARDATMRLLGEARAQTHETWKLLDAALAAEAASHVEAER
jgi:hypothetical protein